MTKGTRRRDIRASFLKGEINTWKKFFDEWDGVNLTVLWSKLSISHSASAIWGIFLDRVIPILEPENSNENKKFRSSIQEYIGKILKEEYCLTDISQEDIKDVNFLERKVPKYLDSVKNADSFFNHLYKCLKTLGFDDETIGIAWAAAEISLW